MYFQLCRWRQVFTLWSQWARIKDDIMCHWVCRWWHLSDVRQHYLWLSLTDGRNRGRICCLWLHDSCSMGSFGGNQSWFVTGLMSFCCRINSFNGAMGTLQTLALIYNLCITNNFGLQQCHDKEQGFSLQRQSKNAENFSRPRQRLSLLSSILEIRTTDGRHNIQHIKTKLNCCR